MTTPANQFRQLSDPVKAIQYREGMHHGELHIIIDHLTGGKSHLQTRYPGCVPHLTTGSTAVRLEPGCWIVAKGTGNPAVYADQAFRDLFVAQDDLDRLRGIAVVEALHAPVLACMDCRHPHAQTCVHSDHHTDIWICAVCCGGHHGSRSNECWDSHGGHTDDKADRCSTVRALHLSTGSPALSPTAQALSVPVDFEQEEKDLGAEDVSALSEISKPANDKAEGTR